MYSLSYVFTHMLGPIYCKTKEMCSSTFVRLVEEREKAINDYFDTFQSHVDLQGLLLLSKKTLQNNSQDRPEIADVDKTL